MKNGIKYTVILIAMLLSTLAILFYFSSVTVFASNNLEDKQQEESFEDFLAFESDVMSFNDDTKVEQISVKEILGHSYSEVLMEKVDEKILDNYCEQNEAYYIETEQGFEVYSDYALKKIIIKGKLSETYGASRIASLNDLHILKYDTEEETKKAYQEFNQDDSLIVVLDKVCCVEDYADEEYDYSSYINYGAQSADIGGFRKYLNDNNVTEEVVVAVLDTGINTAHEMFKDRLLTDENGKYLGFSYYQSKYQYSKNDISYKYYGAEAHYSFEDDQGHGTHVSGIICDLTPSNVKILPIKIGNSNGSSAYHITLTAYKRIIHYVKEYGLNIVSTNLSFSGGPKSSTSERDLYNEEVIIPLKEMGILCATSAGNTATRVNMEGLESVVVSALKKSEKYYEHDYSYSCFGKMVDISAPGSDVVSAYIGENDGIHTNIYKETGGTSMASPQVAGIIALMKLDPQLKGLSGYELEQRLYENCVDLGENGKDDYYGYGMVNLRYFNVPQTETLSFYEDDALIDEYYNYEYFDEDFNLRIECSNLDFKILYTTDETIPSINNNNLYSSPFYIEDSIFLYVMGVKIVNNEVVEKTPLYNISYFDYRTPIEECFEINSSGCLTNYTGKFKYIEIPEIIKGISVKYLDDYLFEHNLILERVVLPNSCVEIGEGTFSQCTNLKYIYGPNVEILDYYAFSSCLSLPFLSSDIPAVGANAGCFLPNIIKLSSYSFESCTSLEYIKIGKKVNSLGTGAFLDTKLNNIYLDEENKKYYCDKNIALYGSKVLYLIASEYNKSYEMLDSVTINGVTTNISNIANYALANTKMKSLTISENIVNIYAYSLIYSNITTIYFNAKNATSNYYYINNTNYSVFYDAKCKNLIFGEDVNTIPNRFAESATIENIYINSINTNLEKYSLYVNSTCNLFLEFNEQVTSNWLSMLYNSGITSALQTIYCKQPLPDSYSSYFSGLSYKGKEENYYVYSKSGYIITATAGEGGIINSVGDNYVSEEQSKTFYITANEGWSIKNVKVNNVSIGAVARYTFDYVTTNQTITAEFEQIGSTYYTISTEIGEGGIITPNNISVLGGESVTLDILADDGYQIKDVLVNGFSVGAINAYTINNITSNQTISVTFEKIKYTVTTVVEGTKTGIVTPTNTYEYGADVLINFTPDEGYIINRIYINNKALNSSNLAHAKASGYIIDNIDQDYEIKVYFYYPTRKITYVPNHAKGENIVKSQYYYKDNINNKKIDFPANPTRAGHTFLGWYFDQNFTKKFDLEYMPNYDLIVFGKWQRNTYTITASSGANGNISPLGETIKDYRSSQKYVFTPNEGYHVKAITINGVALTGTDLNNAILNGYMFTKISDNHEINVEFEINNYQITVNPCSNGTIAPSGNQMVKHGDSITFNFVPSEGYKVYQVYVDGESVGTLSSYTFNNISESHNLSVEFVKQLFIINASSSTNGKITPEGSIEVNYLDSITFVFAPDEGYKIKKVVVDGISLGVLNNYTFSKIQGNHSIFVEFEIIKYFVIVKYGDNGNVSPAGTNEVNYGSSFTIQITPDNGYAVDYIKINGQAVESNNTLELKNITKNFSIMVEFVKVYIISTDSDDNGSITPSTTAKIGSQKIIEFFPNTGYKIKNVIVDDENLGYIEHYIFYNINKDHSIIVEFEIKKFDLKFNITGKGNAEIDSGTKEIVYGDNKTIKIKPESGWEVYKVFVNGQLKDVVGNKFNITNIKSNLDVQIIFKEVEKPWFTSPIALIMISLIVLGITIPIIIKLRKVFNNKVEVDNEDLT